MPAFLIIVNGRVQGVGFRATVHGIATRSGISGHVRNLEDGRVEILAQSLDDATLENFIASIESVRPPALVMRLNKTQIGYSDSVKGFRVIR